MRKTIGLILTGLLVLLVTGCTSQAALVREAVVNSFVYKNFDYQGTLKLTGQPEKLVEAAGETMDSDSQALLDTLKGGIKVSGSQKDVYQSKVVVEVYNDQALRNNGLWSGNSSAAATVYMDSSKFYVTTPLDTKYLLIDAASEEVDSDVQVDPARIKEIQDRLNDLTLDFYKTYFGTYGFTLNEAQNLGVETITLPDGSEVQATHIKIHIDTKELIRMMLFTAKDAASNQAVKDFAVEYLVLMGELTEDPEEPLTEAERRQGAEEIVDQTMKSLKDSIAEYEGQYTLDQMVAEVKEAGLEGLDANLDFYISPEKNIVSNKTLLSISLKTDDNKIVPVGLEYTFFAWNYGQATAFTLPQSGQAVDIDTFKKNMGAVSGFNNKGLIYNTVKKQLISDIESSIDYVNEFLEMEPSDIYEVDELQDEIDSARELLIGLPYGEEKISLKEELDELQVRVNQARILLNVPTLEKAYVNPDGILTVSIKGHSAFKLYAVVTNSAGAQVRCYELKSGQNKIITGLKPGRYTVQAEAYYPAADKSLYSLQKSITITPQMVEPPVPANLKVVAEKGKEVLTLKASITAFPGDLSKAYFRIVSSRGRVLASGIGVKTGSTIQWQTKLNLGKIGGSSYRIEVKSFKYGKFSKTISQTTKLDVNYGKVTKATTLKSTPSSSGKNLLQLKKNNDVQFLGVNGDYYKVKVTLKVNNKYKSYYGYVRKDKVKF